MSTFHKSFVRLIQTCLSVSLVAVIFSQQLHAQGKYQVASQRELTASDLQGKSGAELKIMRNEIFARYGYIFKTNDMKEYFAGQSWYRPTAADVTGKLTAIEKKNVELIKKVESGQIATTPPKPLVPSSNAAGLYPEASARILNGSELSGMTTKQLSIMRNEIFARHGYIFKTTDMKEYFGRQSWYRPSASDVSSVLTVIEKQNIETIKKFEALNNVKLEVNGRQVADIVPYYDSGLLEGSGAGYAVVVYNGGSPAWSVHAFDVTGKQKAYGYDHYSQPDLEWEELQRIRESARSKITASDIATSLTQEPVLQGNGLPPVLSSFPEGDGEIGIAERDNKILVLEAELKYWGDYRLNGPSRDYGSVVLLPTKSTPGRIESTTINSVIHRDSTAALWFNSDDNRTHFASSAGSFKYTPRKGKVGRFINLGRGFATIETVNGKKSWVIYTPNSEQGVAIAIPPDQSIRSMECGGDSDMYYYCSYAGVFSKNDSSWSLQYLIDLTTSRVFAFPLGTTFSGSGRSIELQIPGFGLVNVNEDCMFTDQDDQSVDLSDFTIE